MSTTVSRKTKLADLINYRLRVITQDGRVYIGELLAFDKHMNLVLADCTEERIPQKQMNALKSNGTGSQVKLEKRTLGLVILRGEQVLTTVVESQPLLTKKDRVALQEKQKRQIQKQKVKGKGVVKPVISSTAGGAVSKAGFMGANNNTSSNNGGARKFQPPPGFRRR